MNKLYFNKKFYTLIILLLFNAIVFSQWQKTNGIAGGYFNHIAGNTSNLLSVTNYGTTFEYSNGQWNYRSSLNYIDELYQVQDKWIGISSNNIYLSQNDGLSWDEITPIDNSSFFIKAKVIDNSIYVLTTDSLFSTSDFGLTWDSRTFGDSITSGNETGVLFLQNAFYVKDNIILASGFTSFLSSFSVVAYSSDFGETWQAASFSNGVQNIVVSDIISDGNYFYLANESGFYKSEDGLNWIEMNDGLTISSGSFTSNKFTQYNNGLIAILSSAISGLYTYDGNTWTLLYDETYLTDFAVNNDEIIFCAQGKVFKYQPGNNILLSDNIIASTSKPLASSNGNVFSIYNSKLYRTTDEGENWEVIKDTSSSVLVINGDTLFAVSSNGIIRSDDSGINWITLNSGIPSAYVPKLNTVGLANGKVYAGFNGTRARMHLPPVWEQGGVYVSTNNGVNWNSLNNGLPQEGGVPAPIYQIFADGSVIIINTIAGRFSLVNNTWINIGAGFPANTFVSGLKIFNNDVIFFTNNGLFISHDKGITKEDFNNGLPGLTNYLAILFSYQNELYVCSTDSNAVYKFENDQWNPVDLNLPQNIRFTSAQSVDDIIYAGTYDNGIWKYDPNPTNVDKEIFPKKISLSQNYPNPFNPSTVIKFNLSEKSYIKLIVYDILGKEIATLVNEEKPAGLYEVTFNASPLSSGVYFYKLQSGLFTETKKMLLVK